MWTLQIIPAEPKLGPIYQRITHMVTMDFPVLLVIPAFGLDLVRHRLDGRVHDRWLAPLLAVVFVALFLAVEWPFASFLITSHSRNWFFNGANYVYFMSNQYVARTFGFADWDLPHAALERQTAYLLDLLDELDARATFFLLGMTVAHHGELAVEPMMVETLPRLHVQAGIPGSDTIMMKKIERTPGQSESLGKQAIEGRDYVVRDGDVMHFRFNV